jgi:hypothetical protein
MNAEMNLFMQTRLDRYKDMVAEAERNRHQLVVPLSRPSLPRRLSIAWRVLLGSDPAVILAGKTHA